VTHAGCGAICPAFGRGCYGCFGPARDPNTEAMIRLLRTQGHSPEQIARVFRTFNAAAPAFREAARTVDTDLETRS
jgi:coenzyme F420-reducing hydrogenase gamma subunit